MNYLVSFAFVMGILFHLLAFECLNFFFKIFANLFCFFLPNYICNCLKCLHGLFCCRKLPQTNRNENVFNHFLAYYIASYLNTGLMKQVDI